ncbi:MAG: hypothetical protein H6697_11155 [Myxococcales bacterium]|nr:hypothetical protein [Myxococcales bacterium]
MSISARTHDEEKRSVRGIASSGTFRCPRARRRRAASPSIDRSRRHRACGACADLSSRVSLVGAPLALVRDADKSLRFAVCISSARDGAVQINDLHAACDFNARVDRGARASRRLGVELRGLIGAAGARRSR